MQPDMVKILVTGANRGIGVAIVQSTASRLPSATIILGCRSLEAGHEAVEQLRKVGLKTSFDVVQIDIDNDESIAAAVQAIGKKHGRLDVLLNNAAAVSFPRSHQPGDIRNNLNTVLNNAVASNAIVTKAFMPLLRKSEDPRVIMTSSARGSMERTASGLLPPPRLIDYNIAKAGLNMLTLLLQQVEEANVDENRKIRFWMVSPGFTKTRFNGFQGTKDPLDSAEAFVRLVEAERGAIPAGTFWEFESGEFRIVPW